MPKSFKGNVGEKLQEICDENGMTLERDVSIGHNSGEVSAERLKSFVKRIEKLESDKAGICDDIKDIYAEAKSTGFDVKTIRRIVQLNKKSAQARREEEEMLELYLAALGMD